VKLKVLAVLTLVVLGCVFVSAQTFGFGTSIGGTGLYCNYEQLKDYGGGLWAGVDNLSMCGGTYSTISGFNATVPNTAQAHGKGVVYGDNIYWAYNGAQAQWTVFTKLKCNKKNKSGRYVGLNGWVGVASITGVFAGFNQGPLSCEIPGKRGVVPTAGVSTSAIRGQGGKK
jgi:hypothetical protein